MTRRHGGLSAAWIAASLMALSVGCGPREAGAADAGPGASSRRPQRSTREIERLTHACLQSIAHARERQDDRNAMPDVLRRCGAVFEQPECRDAYRTAADRRGSPATVITACKRAYCPILARPRPVLCTEEVPAEQQSDAWAELFRAMLDRDVGRANREQIDESFRALSETPAVPRPPPGAGGGPQAGAGGGAPTPPEEEMRDPLILRLTPVGGDLQIELEGAHDEHGSWRMPAGSSDEALITLIGETMRPLSSQPIQLRPTPQVQFMDTMVVTSALRGMGFQRIAVR